MKTKNKNTSATVISLTAILISSATAFIGLKETQIMKEQQELYKSQQEVSVWPYLESSTFINVSKKDSVTIKYLIENKGIGPAIMSDVRYTFDGKPIELQEVGEAIENKYNEVLIATQTEFTTLYDDDVIAAREVHQVTSLSIKKKPNSNFDLINFLEEMDGLFQITYCYCSVYHKSWCKDSLGNINQSESCTLRKKIR